MSEAFQEFHDAVARFGRELSRALRLEQIVKWMSARLKRKA